MAHTYLTPNAQFRAVGDLPGSSILSGKLKGYSKLKILLPREFCFSFLLINIKNIFDKFLVFPFSWLFFNKFSKRANL